MKLGSIITIVFVSALALALVGCGPKDKVKNENASAEGRDRDLYTQASKKAEKGRYDEARITYNIIITTYPDSPYLPLAKLAIADTFYLEGGTSNLQQAIGGYKEFAQYFPKHPKICDVKHRIAMSYMRQMGAYNRDASMAAQAERQLKDALAACRNSPSEPKVNTDLATVQQVLGLHELDIARFYSDKRQAPKAAEGRLRGIIANYPNFSYMDETLYRTGVTLVEEEQPEEAAEFFTRLVRDFSKSEYAGKGKEYLEKLGKPVPEPSNDNPAPERPGFIGKFGLIIGRNGLEISDDGVLLSKKGEEKEDTKATAKPSEVSNQPGTRSIRTSSKGPAVADRADSSAPAATPAAGQATGEAGNGTSADQTATPEAKNSDSKKKDKKDKDSKKKKEKKDSPGVSE
ncbi:MAG TPA: outer membrane protein assembly factor BamD [Blastocatellia bacterium]|jgi:outer membrane protein assembly factor BamD|nr:outer membrane protein assembly factor BamD [Blastocatellia bacterium]